MIPAEPQAAKKSNKNVQIFWRRADTKIIAGGKRVWAIARASLLGEIAARDHGE